MTSTEESIGGWREHPDFSTFSDDRLELSQKLIDENIRWAKEAGDAVLETYYEQEMRMLDPRLNRLMPFGDSLSLFFKLARVRF